ncbi:hypothetical protein KC345_g1945 [Hortaea werneckii]|nr:hypothetical protein KC345_g1945 [Hortaea werneckii]
MSPSLGLSLLSALLMGERALAQNAITTTTHAGVPAATVTWTDTTTTSATQSWTSPAYNEYMNSWSRPAAPDDQSTMTEGQYWSTYASSYPAVSATQSSSDHDYNMPSYANGAEADPHDNDSAESSSVSSAATTTSAVQQISASSSTVSSAAAPSTSANQDLPSYAQGAGSDSDSDSDSEESSTTSSSQTSTVTGANGTSGSTTNDVSATSTAALPEMTAGWNSSMPTASPSTTGYGAGNATLSSGLSSSNLNATSVVLSTQTPRISSSTLSVEVSNTVSMGSGSTTSGAGTAGAATATSSQATQTGAASKCGMPVAFAMGAIGLALGL